MNKSVIIGHLYTGLLFDKLGEEACKVEFIADLAPEKRTP